MDKIKVFENLLNKFETEEIKSYCTDMIKEIPDYIFTIPTSWTDFSYSYVCRSYELYTWVGVCKRKNT